MGIVYRQFGQRICDFVEEAESHAVESHLLLKGFEPFFMES